MKKKVALLLTLVMIFSLFAVGCGSNDDAEYAGTVKIGVFEPASGDNGAGGKQETLGIQYANKVQPTVDINGETYKVELVTADNESDTNKGISAAQTLVSSGVSMVLGTYGSAVAIAAGKVFKEAGMPALGITCTNPQVQKAIRFTSVSASSIRSRAQYLQTLHMKTVQEKLTAYPSSVTTTL